MNRIEVIQIPIARFSRMAQLPREPHRVSIGIEKGATVFDVYDDIVAGDRVIGLFALLRGVSGAPDKMENRQFITLTNRATSIEFMPGEQLHRIGSGFADKFFQYHVFELKQY